MCSTCVGMCVVWGAWGVKRMQLRVCECLKFMLVCGGACSCLHLCMYVHAFVYFRYVTLGLYLRGHFRRGGQLPPKWACSSNDPRVWAPRFDSFKLGIKMFQLSRALFLEAAYFGGTCLVSRGVHTTFYHKIFIPDHPLHQSEIFLMV